MAQSIPAKSTGAELISLDPATAKRLVARQL